MGVDPALCHVFEDGDLGLRAAKAAGMFVTDVKPYTLDESLNKTN